MWTARGKDIDPHGHMLHQLLGLQMTHTHTNMLFWCSSPCRWRYFGWTMPHWATPGLLLLTWTSTCWVHSTSICGTTNGHGFRDPVHTCSMPNELRFNPSDTINNHHVTPWFVKKHHRLWLLRLQVPQGGERLWGGVLQSPLECMASQVWTHGFIRGYQWYMFWRVWFIRCRDFRILDLVI